MERFSRNCILVALLACLLRAGFAQNQSPQPASGYVPVQSFDPKRDAAADIEAALAEAQRTGKRAIIDVGGDWCQYCHQMDQLFVEHPDLIDLRDKNFILVKVYYGDKNKNRDALSHYSKLLGIPHLFVLEKDGSMLHSQHVTELRSGGNYDAEKMRAFLLKWAPAGGDRAPSGN